jgi:hypothetical protein
MLKLRVGMMRHGNSEKVFTEIPVFDTSHNYYTHSDTKEATAISQLLVGVWFSCLFRNPILMLSNSNKNINPAVMWCANLIFEHLMSLEKVDTYKYKDLIGLDFTKINEWLSKKHP